MIDNETNNNVHTGNNGMQSKKFIFITFNRNIGRLSATIDWCTYHITSFDLSIENLNHKITIKYWHVSNFPFSEFFFRQLLKIQSNCALSKRELA